jgi:hypothetical protein
MKRVVQDQLANCKFSRSGRRMIRDSVRIGCGLLMGPHRAICTKRKFRNGPMGMAIEIEETEVPEIREGDPWCFFPDMTVTVEKSEFAFYAHVMGKLEVRNLADAPGFDPEQVAALVQLEPDMGEFGTNLATRNAGLDLIEPTSGKYVVWRYTGVLNAEQLELLGCTCETGEDATEGGEGDAPDAAVLPDMAMVDLWFSQGCVLRAKMTPIQNDYRIPYFVFSPFPSDDSMFGLSVPELCTDSQRVAESAWLIALVNASVSSGPLVISRRGKIAPRDGEYKLRGPKWIEALDDNIELKDTFAVHDFPNYVDRALQIFDRAMGIMDEELNTAQWGSTQNSEEAQTASGMAMLLNVRSILQVRVATAADDEVFGPIIERLYWWNMLYNPDDSIKGDYDVAPLVQSVRLVKDVQVQHLQAFTAMSGDPRFAPFVDTYALLKANAGMMDFPAMEFIKSREQAEAEMANKGPDPQALLAQAKAENEQARAVLAQVQAEAEKQRMAMEQAMAQLKMQAAHQDAAFRVADRQIDHEEAVDMAEIREREAESRVRVAELREETARMALAEKSRAGEASVRAKLIDRGMQTEAQAREMALKQRTGSGI